MQKNLILLSQQAVMKSQKVPRVHQRNFLSMKRHSPKPIKQRKRFKKHRIIFLINENFRRKEFMMKKSKKEKQNLCLKSRPKGNRRVADFNLLKNRCPSWVMKQPTDCIVKFLPLKRITQQLKLHIKLKMQLKILLCKRHTVIRCTRSILHIKKWKNCNIKRTSWKQKHTSKSSLQKIPK